MGDALGYRIQVLLCAAAESLWEKWVLVYAIRMVYIRRRKLILNDLLNLTEETRT